MPRSAVGPPQSTATRTGSSSDDDDVEVVLGASRASPLAVSSPLTSPPRPGEEEGEEEGVEVGREARSAAALATTERIRCSSGTRGRWKKLAALSPAAARRWLLFTRLNLDDDDDDDEDADAAVVCRPLAAAAADADAMLAERSYKVCYPRVARRSSTSKGVGGDGSVQRACVM